MAFCRNCGSEIHDEAVVCVNCGVPVEIPNAPRTDDKKSGGFAFLCFMFPMLGLILWIIWKDDYPLKAKSCAKGAIVSVVLSAVFSILFFVAYFLGLSVFLNNTDISELYAQEVYEYLMIKF